MHEMRLKIKNFHFFLQTVDYNQYKIDHTGLISMSNHDTHVLEYVWLDAIGNFRSKAKIMRSDDLKLRPTFPKEIPLPRLEHIPKWNYDGSSTGQADGKDSEVLLVPVRVTHCPFRGHHNFVVLCETQDREGKSLSTRSWAKAIFDQDLDAKPWFGLEQEYFQYGPDGLPLGLSDAIASGKGQGQYYCSVGHGNAYGRHLADCHMKACTHAGLKISGINAEVAPGQWEFQIGPVEGINAGDELLLARYFLVLAAEKLGLSVDFHPKPKVIQDAEGEWNGSGCHCNFSTANMRTPCDDKSGLSYIESAVKRLKKAHALHMKYYGEGNELRMTGKCETAEYDKFTAGRANRSASVRIPNDTVDKGYGYFEDRRPSSNCDPYRVTALLFGTTHNIELGIDVS